MNLTGGAGVLPEAMARAITEDATSSVRDLASSVRREERLDFARAVVFRTVSAYWKALQAVSGRGWPLRELPFDTGRSPVPEEAEAQAERIGTAAAGLDVLDAGYLIGVLYTGLRQAALMTIATEAGFSEGQVAFLTAYTDRDDTAFKASVSELAWRSFAWFMSEPDHIVVLCGGSNAEPDLLPALRRPGRAREVLSLGQGPRLRSLRGHRRSVSGLPARRGPAPPEERPDLPRVRRPQRGRRSQTTRELRVLCERASTGRTGGQGALQVPALRI